jgi:heme/copper-type cytochrome/quinol oxidase subunit 2
VKVPSSVKLWVAPEWKKGPDGEKHDAYSKTNFTVKVGQPLLMTIDNRDDTVHSITSGEAGVNIVVKPGIHTYTLIVHHTGHFKWICAYPCDPFAMDRAGYMGGYITAV